MPQAAASLLVTDAYRDRLEALRTRVEARARSEWPKIAELDRTRWPDRVATVVSQAQAEAVRLTAGYLTAYLTTELGTRTRAPALASESFAGRSRTGQPLAETMRAPIYNVLGALKAGDDPETALGKGWQKAHLLIELDLMTAARESLQAGLEADDRFTGWRRAVRGTCGACLGASDEGTQPAGTPMHIHPNCKCVAEPSVRGAKTNLRPSGRELFDAMTAAEQEAAVGPEPAASLRAGEITLADLVRRERYGGDADNFITQASLEGASRN